MICQRLRWLYPVLGLMLMVCGLAQADPQAEANENLIPNGGFEQVGGRSQMPQAWSWQAYPASVLGEEVHLAIEKELVDAGDHAFAMRLTGNSASAILQTARVSVKGGEHFELTFRNWRQGGRLTVRQNYHSADGRMLTDLFKTTASDGESEGWQTATVSLTVPKDDRVAFLSLSFMYGRGPGRCILDSVQMRRKAFVAPDHAFLIHTPHGWHEDPSVRLPAGNAMQLFLTPYHPRGYQPQHPRLILEVPAGIEVLGTDYNAVCQSVEDVRRAGQAYRRYTYTIGLGDYLLTSTDDQRSGWRSLPVVVRAAPDMAGFSGVAYAWLGNEKSSEERQAAEHQIPLQVTEPIAPVKAPRRFRVGANLVASCDLTGPALAAFVELYQTTGFNTAWLPDILRPASTSGPNPHRDVREVVQAFKHAGMETWAVTAHLVNGFEFKFMPQAAEVPGRYRIRDVTGKIMPDTFDPLYIAHGGDLYWNAVERMILRYQDLGFDHVWSNWEPWRYRIRSGNWGGIFSDLALTAVAKALELPVEELLRMGFDQVVETHGEALYPLYSQWHAQVVNALVSRLGELSADRSTPMLLDLCVGYPMLVPRSYSAGESTYQSYAHSFAPEAFVEHLNATSSWYYLRYSPEEEEGRRAAYQNGFRSKFGTDIFHASFAATLKMVEEVKAYHRSVSERTGRSLRYTHLVQGKQGNHWLITPEELEIQMLAAFLGGADAVQLYYFPRGYDGRYWQAAARAVETIARWEDHLHEGVREDARVQVRNLSPALQDPQLASHLVHRAFEKDGQILVAVGNFNLRWPAYVQLQPASEEMLWSLAEPGQVGQLGIGSRLLAGASEWGQQILRIAPGQIRFFLLSPSASESVDPSLDVQALASTYQQEMAAQQEAFPAWQEKYADYLLASDPNPFD